MSQRLMLASSILMTVVCLAVLGLVWTIAERGQQVNAAILEQLAALRDDLPSHSPQSLEWNPARFRLVLDEEGHPPAEGFTVVLEGHALSSSETIDLREQSNEEGEVDFGLVRTGRYDYRIRTPWSESTKGRLIVRPGQERAEEIVCPASPAVEDVEIVCDVDWPNDLRNEDLWVVYHLEGLRSPSQTIGGRTWESRGWSWFYLVVTPSGRTLAMRNLSDLPGQFHWGSRGPLTPMVLPISEIESTDPLRVQPNRYVVSRISILEPTDELVESTLRKFDLHVHIEHQRLIQSGREIWFRWVRSEASHDDTERDVPEPQDFLAEPGQENRWEIELPVEELRNVRDRLQEAEALNNAENESL